MKRVPKRKFINLYIYPMNFSKITSLCCIIFLILLVSCSKDDPTPQNPSTSENSWKLDAYKYGRRTSTQTSTLFTNGDPYTVVYIDSNIATANNPFTNCSLILTFNTSTTGDYVIKSQSTTLSNSASKYMHIRCIVLSSVGTAATYDSTDGNLIASVTQVDGKYVVTISTSTSLTQTLNDGLVQAPNSFVLTADKVR